MAKTSFSVTFVLLLPALLINAVSSAYLSSTKTPKRDYRELVTGPGFPTLAELNLTSEQLYTMTPNLQTRVVELELASRSDRYTNECFTYTTANVDDVIACFNYLQNIGSNTCAVNGDNVQFCYAGTAQISGSNISGTSSAASRCSDVALAVQWIFTYCNVGGQVGGGLNERLGAAAANGNGYLVVGVENIDW
ncbi:hypothetical protein C8R42DRAFT_643451 [Lentinula raphanica]|nr:hypothetical protein C8R42DRAFT_643451 [Lentinula raphanica]